MFEHLSELIIYVLCCFSKVATRQNVFVMQGLLASILKCALGNIVLKNNLITLYHDSADYRLKAFT